MSENKKTVVNNRKDRRKSWWSEQRKKEKKRDGRFKGCKGLNFNSYSVYTHMNWVGAVYALYILVHTQINEL